MGVHINRRLGKQDGPYVRATINYFSGIVLYVRHGNSHRSRAAAKYQSLLHRYVEATEGERFQLFSHVQANPAASENRNGKHQSPLIFNLHVRVQPRERDRKAG